MKPCKRENVKNLALVCLYIHSKFIAKQHYKGDPHVASMYHFACVPFISYYVNRYLQISNVSFCTKINVSIPPV